MKIRSIIFPVLLALLLLLSQQMGWAHAVSHLANLPDSSQTKQLPIEQVCDQCLSFAQIGAALPTHFSLPLVHLALAPVFDFNRTFAVFPAADCVFLSRAPPTVM